MASLSHLRPKEKGKITVSVNLKGKLGNISKTVQIYTNDPKRPVTTLFITMQAKDTTHIKKYKADEIFTEQCRRCHVEQGKGKKGFELFIADCIMCHNIGKNASTILEMRTMSKEDIIKTIKEGVDNTSMPGWDIKNGGPLKDDEIESLIDLLNTPN